MPYYTQPHKDYCIAIGVFLKYLKDNYSNEVIKKISNRFEEHTILKLSTSYMNRIRSGYNLSNLLIDTPSHLIYSFYKLESGISSSIKLLNKPTTQNNSINFKIYNQIFNLAIDQVADINNEYWLYIYCYWLRKGYSVIEENYTYIVTEPLGVSYCIDSYSCNCPNGINRIPCLHLQLCQWYKLSLSYLNKKEINTYVN
jgi:hypothetical protein